MPNNFSFRGLPKADLPDEMQSAWDRSMAVRGEARFVGAAGHAPELFDWYMNSFYQRLFFEGRVERKYKSWGACGCLPCTAADPAIRATGRVRWKVV